MRAARLFNLGLLAAAVVLFAAIAWAAAAASNGLGDPAYYLGWLLLLVMLGLAAFNVRKRLSMVPLGRAVYWLGAHIIGGVFALGIFWLHTGSFWPSGYYEQALALFFYLVSLSGIVGYVLQRLFPRHLTQLGYEVIYERIPAELAALREEAETAVLACTEETGSDTLARYYIETLRWYFQQPRFFLSHAFGGSRARHWVNHQCDVVARYLNDAEKASLEQVRAMALRKEAIDGHYAGQSLIKGWLMFHLPLAVGVMILALWHVILVHVYAV